MGPTTTDQGDIVDLHFDFQENLVQANLKTLCTRPFCRKPEVSFPTFTVATLSSGTYKLISDPLKQYSTVHNHGPLGRCIGCGGVTRISDMILAQVMGQARAQILEKD